MDVVIPGHSIRTFSSSVATLSKIGNYLYIEFDPLLGLTLRTLNDAKSAFAEFHFEVGFFERCTSPPPPPPTLSTVPRRNHGGRRDRSSGGKSNLDLLPLSPACPRACVSFVRTSDRDVHVCGRDADQRIRCHREIRGDQSCK